jgi:hypothetical protein
MVTQERIKQLLTYSPETGEFRWIKTRARLAMRRQVAGRIANTGYIAIGIDGSLYTAHRLAFVYMTGAAPSSVDHINRLKTDNRWENLRAANKQMNAMNTKKKASASAYKGVTPYRDRWRAKISFGGKTKHLGIFDTETDAHAAYMRAAESVAGNFATAGI